VCGKILLVREDLLETQPSDVTVGDQGGEAASQATRLPRYDNFFRNCVDLGSCTLRRIAKRRPEAWEKLLSRTLSISSGILGLQRTGVPREPPGAQEFIFERRTSSTVHHRLSRSGLGSPLTIRMLRINCVSFKNNTRTASVKTSSAAARRSGVSRSKDGGRRCSAPIVQALWKRIALFSLNSQARAETNSASAPTGFIVAGTTESLARGATCSSFPSE